MTLTEFKIALQLIKVIYESDKGSVGGDLHLVLDDNNCESGHLQYCWELIHENPILSGEALEAEKRLLVLLAKLNYAERLAITSSINWWYSEFDPEEIDGEAFNPVSLINTWMIKKEVKT